MTRHLEMKNGYYVMVYRDSLGGILGLIGFAGIKHTHKTFAESNNCHNFSKVGRTSDEAGTEKKTKVKLGKPFFI